MNKRKRNTEEKVLDVYKKENPSTYEIEESEKKFRKNEEFASRLYGTSLKLLPQVFRDATLLEFGSGTGERSLSFLKWGARCTFVDMNEDALQRAKFLYEKFMPDAEYRLEHCSLFDFQTDETFDITVSNGVIHHTADNEAAFARQVSFLKPGGINILGIGNSGGFVQRNLQRLIIHVFAGDDVEKIESVAEDLFKDHLDRAEKYGGRQRKAIIHDTYVNPKMDFVSVSDLLKWYRTYGLRFYSSWPPVIPAILADGLGGEIEWKNYPELLSRPEWIWSTQADGDESMVKFLEAEASDRSKAFRAFSESLNDSDPANISIEPVRSTLNDVQNVFSASTDSNLSAFRKFQPWLNEVDEILKALENEDFESCSNIIKKSSMLFQGKNGLGMTYFVAIKE